MIILEIIENAIDYVTSYMQHGGVSIGILLVLLESLLPVLPLGVFIALNINAYGIILGVIISWLSTCLGCYLSFLLFRILSRKLLYNLLKKKNIKQVVKRIEKIEFSNLVVLIALPFTPAFLINIASGISNMSKKKFIYAILLGKIFMVIFWGCVGKSLLESVTDIKTIIIVSIFILVAYVLSKFINKKMKIE